MNKKSICMILMAAAICVSGMHVFAADTVDSGKLQAYYTQEAENAPKVADLSCLGKMPLTFAESFDVYLYEGDYKLIDVPSAGQYLIIPENASIPEGAADTYKVLCTPIDNVYLAATSAMSLIDAIGATGHITMTGTDVGGWHIQAPIDALQSGAMMYAGKYSEPNYELLVGHDCYLAIESTMIYHSPEVQEMLEAIDIPVFIDRSSYESTGLGRTEWIKAYGAMFNAEEAAFERFDQQMQILEEMQSYENTGRTVAFVSVSQDGSCVIRRPDDYIAAMVEQGGGTYVFHDAQDLCGGGATVTISMEEFYSKAVDADYLVYNGTIVGAVDGKQTLLDKSELFADFNAFQNDQIFQVDSSLYQSTDHVTDLVRDFHIMVTDGEESRMTFLSRLAPQ